MDNTKPIVINDFRGGLCSNLPISNLQVNQASDLDNIVIKPNGQGFRSRLGNTLYVSTTFNSGANCQGIGYLLTSAQAVSIGAVFGNKFYDVINGNDRTGSLTITAGADDQWDFFAFNDQLLAFGGPSTSPDVPFEWNGTSGNATVLTGTPPSAYGAFTTNNRVFAFRTAANPSTMYWSIIANENNWTGAGSGNATIGSLSDSQRITAATILSTNYVIVFKDTSCYQMVTSSAPFPVYSLFDTVGCPGKGACLSINGTAYWINQYGRMVSTDGENLKEYPPNTDDKWNAVQVSRYPYIKGFRQKGADYDWVVWMVSTTGSTNNIAIIWDLLNGCWLQCTTGYNFNVLTSDNGRVNYMGGYNGHVYLLDVAATYTDASNGSAAIASYWRSGWINPQINNEIVQVQKAIATYSTKASGNITLNYGFDFNLDSKSVTFSQTATGSELYTSRLNVLTGRGNFFNFKVGLSSSSIDMNFQSLTLRGKVYGQKRISAS